MTVNYDELTKQVLNIYPEIKFAGIVNVKGEIVAGGHKENVEQILEGDEVKMSIHYAIQKRDLYTNLAYKIGHEKSAITEFEKVILISIPMNSNELFLVRTDIGVNYSKIIEFIYSKIDPQKHIRDEINLIQNEIEKLKNLKVSKPKRRVVKRKPARKTAKRRVVKRKPARKTAKRRGVKRKPARKTAKRRVVKRKPARSSKSKRKTRR
ncbi:MAG: hypothetical protein COA77_08335 [Thaumarchaeota archaeon]|nr:MAG: hypothetical protein COA77_08335 [Nitrososphaerota archaeon]